MPNLRPSLPWILVALSLIASSCNGSPAAPAEDLARTMVAETARAGSTSTPPPALATKTPLRPTSTKRPPTPTPGPLVLDDGFVGDPGFFEDCPFCNWKNDMLVLGPAPVSEAYTPVVAYCTVCGEVTNYTMSVDATFEDGSSERGYGFIVRETKDYLLTAEITPWQTVAVWKLDFDRKEWIMLNGMWTGLVKPGKITNRIEVIVAPASNGKSTISFKVNGRTPLVISGQPTDSGFVGPYLFGHGTTVLFDNFSFVEAEPYGERPFGGASGSASG